LCWCVRAQQALIQRRTGECPLAHISGIRRPPLRRCPARSWCDGSPLGSRFSVCSQAFLVAYVHISCFVHRTAAFGWAGSGGAFSLSARGAPASCQCFARLRRGPGARSRFFCTLLQRLPAALLAAARGRGWPIPGAAQRRQRPAPRPLHSWATRTHAALLMAAHSWATRAHAASRGAQAVGRGTCPGSMPRGEATPQRAPQNCHGTQQHTAGRSGPAA